MSAERSRTTTADGVYTTTCWECSAYCGALATVKDRATDIHLHRPERELEHLPIGREKRPAHRACVHIGHRRDERAGKGDPQEVLGSGREQRVHAARGRGLLHSLGPGASRDTHNQGQREKPTPRIHPMMVRPRGGETTRENQLNSYLGSGGF